MKSSAKPVIFKIFFYLTLTAVTFLAFLPNDYALSSLLSFSDLLNHTVAFSILFLLLERAYPSIGIRNLLIVLFIYALCLEAVQYLLPDHSAAWSDIAADCAGMLIGYLAMTLLTRHAYTRDLFRYRKLPDE